MGPRGGYGEKVDRAAGTSPHNSQRGRGNCATKTGGEKRPWSQRGRRTRRSPTGWSPWHYCSKKKGVEGDHKHAERKLPNRGGGGKGKQTQKIYKLNCNCRADNYGRKMGNTHSEKRGTNLKGDGTQNWISG